MVAVGPAVATAVDELAVGVLERIEPALVGEQGQVPVDGGQADSVCSSSQHGTSTRELCLKSFERWSRNAHHLTVLWDQLSGALSRERRIWFEKTMSAS